MLFDLPEKDVLYAALLARDSGYDGRAFVGVTTTGILCRLTCPARKPKPENCTFFETTGAGLAAGFRPCKRCRPLGTQEPDVARLLAALEDAPARRWREADIVAMQLDPSTMRRAFRRQFGITFLEMARQRRLSEGLETLAAGERVIDAQIDAGFESASAFRAAVAKLLGQPPGALRPDALLRADWIATPLGAMIAVATERALVMLEFRDRKGLPRALQRLTAKTGLALAALGRSIKQRSNWPPSLTQERRVFRADCPPGDALYPVGLGAIAPDPSRRDPQLFTDRPCRGAADGHTCCRTGQWGQSHRADRPLPPGDRRRWIADRLWWRLWRKDRLIALEHEFRAAAPRPSQTDPSRSSHDT